MGFLSNAGLARFWAGIKARFVTVENRVSSLESGLAAQIAAAILEADKRKQPVGSILMSTSSANPSTYLGFGTWTAWGAGRVPIGVNASDTDFNAAEKSGGAKSQQIGQANLPGIRPTLSVRTNDGQTTVLPAFTGYVNLGQWVYTPTGGMEGAELPTGGNLGNGTLFNNLPPYLTCYMWKRVM